MLGKRKASAQTHAQDAVWEFQCSQSSQKVGGGWEMMLYNYTEPASRGCWAPSGRSAIFRTDHTITLRWTKDI